MADSGKKPNQATTVGKSESPLGVQDPLPTPPSEVDQVSTPNESPSASTRVRPLWPTSSFTVEGVPEITDGGTMLTKSQLRQAQSAAETAGVQLDVEEDD